VSPSSSSPEPSNWHPAAAVAAWILPGLGHFILGQRQRGAILCVTIGVLWLAGMIIGGISVFDHREHPAWFVGQMLMAPSVVMDQTIVHKLKPYTGESTPDSNPAYEPSYGRVNEQGVLYTALAGLLNLLAILDVVYQDARLRENDRDKPRAKTPSAVPPAA
jgi:TM2 domain-containing membrane protein YozV